MVAAMALPGVRTVLTGEDVQRWSQPFVVGVDVTLDSLQQAIHDSLPSLLLIGAATLGVGLLLSWLAARMLVHGILLLTGQLNRIADHRDLSP